LRAQEKGDKNINANKRWLSLLQMIKIYFLNISFYQTQWQRR
jgi:hypothetical protein